MARTAGVVSIVIISAITLLCLRAGAQVDPVEVSAKLALQHYVRATAAVANAERDAQLALSDNQPPSVLPERVRSLISTRDDLESALNDLRRLDRQSHSRR